MLATVFNTKTMEFIPQAAEPVVRLHLLVIDADAAVRSACVEIAAGLGYAVESTGDLGQARSLLRGKASDIVLVNLPSGGSQGLELVSEVKLLYPQTSVIAMTASGSVNTAVEAEGGKHPVDLTGEDLTRILVNLVKNATESMRTAGTIRIALAEQKGDAAATPRLSLMVEDTGPGIPAELREKIFAPGFTTHTTHTPGTPTTGWLVDHRGLGLSITRSIVEAAGGRISAGCSEQGGARFEIELPVRRR